jgi:hypothetical protein
VAVEHGHRRHGPARGPGHPVRPVHLAQRRRSAVPVRHQPPVGRGLLGLHRRHRHTGGLPAQPHRDRAAEGVGRRVSSSGWPWRSPSPPS